MLTIYCSFVNKRQEGIDNHLVHGDGTRIYSPTQARCFKCNSLLEVKLNFPAVSKLAEKYSLVGVNSVSRDSWESILGVVVCKFILLVFSGGDLAFSFYFLFFPPFMLHDYIFLYLHFVFLPSFFQIQFLMMLSFNGAFAFCFCRHN